MDKLVYSDDVTKHNFVSKVLALFGFQVLFSFVFSLFPLLIPSVQQFLYNNYYMLSFGIIMFIGNIIALYYNRRNTPYNYILLGTMTINDAFMIGLGCAAYAPVIICKSLFITLCATMSTILFAYINRNYEFKWYKHVIVSMFSSLLVLISVQYVFRFGTTLDSIISYLCSVFLLIFLFYDSHAMFTKFNKNEYIIASIDLYLGFINLMFLTIDNMNALIDKDDSTIINSL